MAMAYLDDLASWLIKTGIPPGLVKQEPGICIRSIDLSRFWAHDETLQFVNYSTTGQSKKLIYGGAGHDCNVMTKENRESFTIHPFY